MCYAPICASMILTFLEKLFVYNSFAFYSSEPNKKKPRMLKKRSRMKQRRLKKKTQLKMVMPRKPMVIQRSRMDSQPRRTGMKRRTNLKNLRSQRKMKRRKRQNQLHFTHAQLRTGLTSSSSLTAWATTLTCATLSSSWPRFALFLASRTRKSMLMSLILTPAPTLWLYHTLMEEF